MQTIINNALEKDLLGTLLFNTAKIRMKFKENSIVLGKLGDTQEILSNGRYMQKFIKQQLNDYSNMK